jgi:hypothetical protein
MKRILFSLITFCSVVCFGQYPITGINISMPAKPDANTANWGQGAIPFSISAQTKLDSNRITDPNVMESKILVTIKKGGGKVCGTYTSATAPASNFNSALKVWNGRNGVSLLGQDCVLPPGEYELCVQFFGSRNGTLTDFSEDKCKSFTIEGTDNISYQPPQNVSPADGTVIKEADAKKPITFRWTPVVPKPQGDVNYKVRIVEILPGQNKTEALRSNSPILEREVTNMTQLPGLNINRGGRAIGSDSKYGWYVQATGKDGKDYGVSEATTFSVGSQNSVMTAQCNFTPKLDSIYCTGPCGNGKMGYRVRIKLDNTAIGSTLMNFANATNYSLQTPIPAYSNVNTINNLIQAWNTTPSPYGSANALITVTPVSPLYPATIAAGTAITREVDICVPANTVLPIRLKVFISMISSNGVPNQCNDDVLITTLPPCPCTYCKDDMIVFNGANPITDAGNILTLNNNISIPGIQVKQFKAELIGISYAPQNNNEQCWVCSKDDDQWGNFTAGTFSSPFPSMVNGVFPSLPCCGGNSHHTIGWWGTPTVINNKPLQLKISLPPASTLSCCPYNITICIRYTFTDVECRSCSIVKCFSYVRQPKPGPIIDVYEPSLPGGIKN